MTVAAVEAMELSQLLCSLLASVVEAQAASARATVDFVESVVIRNMGIRLPRLPFDLF